MKKFSFIDKEGKEIKCYKWESEGEARGVIQISHGMTEYACRYDYVAKKFSENGFIVYAHDHRGHGETSKSEEERGYIADKEGFDLLVEDVKELSDIIKKENETKELLCHGLFIYIGFEPIIPNVPNLKLNDNYIVVDEKMQTNIDNICACGDIIKKDLYQIITAAGEGATAANTIKNNLNKD